MLSTEEFQQLYTIIDCNYGQKFQKKLQVQKVDKDGQEFISFDLKQLQLDKEIQNKLRRMKYIGLKQPELYILNKSQQILIFKDLLINQLSKEKLIEYDQQLTRILVQIILAYNEFENRKLEWQISDIGQIYFVKGIVLFLIFDYIQNTNKKEREQLFQNLILQHFQAKIPLLKVLLNQQNNDNFQQLTEYLFEQLNIPSGCIGVEAPYEQTIKLLFNIPNSAELIYYEGLCIIKKFDTQEELKEILPNAAQQMIFKQKKNHKNYEYYNEINKNIDREIQILEKNSEYKQLANCYCYFRIYDKAFVFMKFFKCTLNDILTQWKVNKPEFYKLKVYYLCDSLSTAVFELKKSKLIHRDLKPQNLFLEDWNENDPRLLNNFQIIIGDFDRSKDWDQEKSFNYQQEIKMTEFNTENTQEYDPPEQVATEKYDIWQYGLICFTIANYGEFPGCNQGCRELSDQDYDSYFSLEKIKKTLEHTDYEEEFLQTIANCLKKNHNERPSSDNIHKIMLKLYQSEKEKYSIKMSQMLKKEKQVIQRGDCSDNSCSWTHLNGNSRTFLSITQKQGDYSQPNESLKDESSKIKQSQIQIGECREKQQSQTPYSSKIRILQTPQPNDSFIDESSKIKQSQIQIGESKEKQQSQTPYSNKIRILSTSQPNESLIDDEGRKKQYSQTPGSSIISKEGENNSIQWNKTPDYLSSLSINQSSIDDYSQSSESQKDEKYKIQQSQSFAISTGMMPHQSCEYQTIKKQWEDSFKYYYNSEESNTIQSFKTPNFSMQSQKEKEQQSKTFCQNIGSFLGSIPQIQKNSSHIYQTNNTTQIERNDSTMHMTQISLPKQNIHGSQNNLINQQQFQRKNN